MYRFVEYAIFFIVLILLQVLLFNNLNISVYISPLAYIAFILLLPMRVTAFATLMLGLLTGISIDFLTGTAGIHTIATLATAFCRPKLLSLIAGKEVVAEGGVPTSQKLGTMKFIRYISLAVLLHCTIFFCFETMNVSYFHLTLLKILLSGILTIILIYFSQMLLIGNYGRKNAI